MYPKLVTKPVSKYENIKERRTVHNEKEEYQAGKDGFERHWNKKINEKEKGTSKEILRVDPEKVVEEKLKKK